MESKKCVSSLLRSFFMLCEVKPLLFSSVGLAKGQPRWAGCLGLFTPLRGLDQMDFLPINVSKILVSDARAVC